MYRARAKKSDKLFGPGQVWAQISGPCWALTVRTRWLRGHFPPDLETLLALPEVMVKRLSASTEPELSDDKIPWEAEREPPGVRVQFWWWSKRMEDSKARTWQRQGGKGAQIFALASFELKLLSFVCTVSPFLSFFLK